MVIQRAAGGGACLARPGLSRRLDHDWQRRSRSVALTNDPEAAPTTAGWSRRSATRPSSRASTRGSLTGRVSYGHDTSTETLWDARQVMKSGHEEIRRFLRLIARAQRDRVRADERERWIPHPSGFRPCGSTASSEVPIDTRLTLSPLFRTSFLHIEWHLPPGPGTTDRRLGETSPTSWLRARLVCPARLYPRVSGQALSRRPPALTPLHRYPKEPDRLPTRPGASSSSPTPSDENRLNARTRLRPRDPAAFGLMLGPTP